jgi:HPt (histidine-containing phosphotransfer) domain-containing protein
MENNFQQIRTEQLDSISSGDKAFKTELIEIFLEQIPSFISNIKLFFEKNDLANLAKEAHTAKSSALIFGLTNAGELLKEIQLQAENKKVDKLPELVGRVILKLSDAEKQLKKLLVSFK